MRRAFLILFIAAAGASIFLVLLQPEVRNEDISTDLPKAFTAPNQIENALAYAFRKNAQLNDLRFVISKNPINFYSQRYDTRTFYYVLEENVRQYKILFMKDSATWLDKIYFSDPWTLTWDSANQRVSARRSTFLGDYFDYAVVYSFVWYPTIQIAILGLLTLWSALAIVGCFDDPSIAEDIARSARAVIIVLTVIFLYAAAYGHGHLNDLAVFDWMNDAWNKSFSPHTYYGTALKEGYPKMWQFSPITPEGRIKYYGELFGGSFSEGNLVAAFLLLVPAAVIVFLLSTGKKFFIGLYYVCTSHPAADVVRRSKGTASDHIALADALLPAVSDEPDVPPPPHRSHVLRHKAEALTALIKRKQAERGLLKEHEDFVRREHRRKQERQ